MSIPITKPTPQQLELTEPSHLEKDAIANAFNQVAINVTDRNASQYKGEWISKTSDKNERVTIKLEGDEIIQVGVVRERG